MANEPIDNKTKKKFAVSKMVTYILGGLVLLFCLLLIFRRPGGSRPENIEITIKSLPNNINFLSQEDLHKIVDTALQSAHYSKAYCEQLLEKNPYVKRAEVYQDLSGKLKCNIIQRQPIVRIVNAYQSHYYLDKDGVKFPAQTGTSARVVVANGLILEKVNPQDTMKTQTVRNLFAIATYIEQEVFWKQFTEQLYVDKLNDIHLIPKVGSFTIVLGNADRLDEKFKNLKVFITKALPVVGWEKYRTINAKYKNQIVTVKN